MAYEMKPESGTLFKNTRKETDQHPDYQGECLINGTAYYMSAWLNESKKGTKFMAFRFKPKGETGKAAVKQARAELTPALQDFIDDDIPF